MPPPLGNDYGCKLKDPEVKKMVYAAYLEHLAAGKAKKSFVFRHPDNPKFFCLYETVERYMKEEEDGSGPIQIDAAMRAGYAKWEQVVEDSAVGINKNANTASLQMIMRNKFSWDKKKDDDEESFIPPEAENTSGDLVNESH